MDAIFKILIWIFQRCFKVVVILFVVLAVGFGWKYISAEITEIGNVEELKGLADREAEIGQKLDNVRQRIADSKVDKPSWLHPVKRMAYNASLEALEAREKQLKEIKNGLTFKKVKLDQNTSGLSRFIYHFLQYAKMHYISVLSVVLGLLLSPYILRTIFYGLAWNLDKTKPVKLASSQDGTAYDTQIGNQGNKLAIEVKKDMPFVVKDSYLTAYDKEGCKKKTRILWNWKYFFLSCAARLYFLTEVHLKKGRSESSRVMITTEDPDTQLAEIHLTDHPGMVVRPKAVAGFSGPIKLRSKWVLNNLNSLISGQIRYLIFHGTGSIFVEGYKGIESIGAAEPVCIEKSNLVGFDSRIDLKASRTETFFPYLRGKTALVDYQFMGPYNTVYELACRDKEKDGVTALLNNLVSAVGKFFGF